MNNNNNNPRLQQQVSSNNKELETKTNKIANDIGLKRIMDIITVKDYIGIFHRYYKKNGSLLPTTFEERVRVLHIFYESYGHYNINSIIEHHHPCATILGEISTMGTSNTSTISLSNTEDINHLSLCR